MHSLNRNPATTYILIKLQKPIYNSLHSPDMVQFTDCISLTVALVSFRQKNKLYSLQTAQKYSLHSPDRCQSGSQIRTYTPSQLDQNSRARKTTFLRSSDLSLASCFLDFLHLAHTLNITVLEWNFIAINSCIVGKTTIDHIEISTLSPAPYPPR